MCERFYRGSDSGDDQRFQDWMASNPTGYVFNHFGGRNASTICSTISRALASTTQAQVSEKFAARIDVA